MSSLPYACIIGAGSSGIAGAKVFHERGIPFDCFEKSDQVGGNWVFGNKNKLSSAYTTLHINTSRERMEYSDFPMPKSYPDFPHHTHIARYFNDYVDHFGFRDRIAFETEVSHATRRDDGVWEVTLDGAETRLYDCVLVANGTTGIPAGRSRRFPESSTERRSTPTTTPTPTSCAASGSWCWGWATAPWTSRSTPPMSPSARSSPRAAAPT
jgi:cation diffusion facilitator CzcD-associated flavoprotein CzcO